MKITHDLSQLDWKLSGWIPHLWRMQHTMEIGASPNAEVPAIPAKVPGSVQFSLKEAGLLPDWNVGLNYRDCEWVENRHWIYETRIPDAWMKPGLTFRLNCRGLDYCGSIIINGREVSAFCGSHVPHVFDITPHLAEKDNVIRIAFELPPRWLGQFGYTSRMTEWKVRFNYTWDWTVRLVQMGISNSIYLEATDGAEIASARCSTDADYENSTGMLSVNGRVNAGDNHQVRIILRKQEQVIETDTVSVAQFNECGVEMSGFPVELWWPNLEGDQPLYDLNVELVGPDGAVIDQRKMPVGFRNIRWEMCEDSPEGADTWICVVNGRPVFLQGANWVPVLPNFADATPDRYRKLLETYKDLGANILRVWGGASLERECFYEMCNELGLMVWQEFPLSSSGIDNWPPEDDKSIAALTAIARSYIERRQHHPSLIVWCGGNELQGNLAGGKTGGGKPCDLEHPLLCALDNVVSEMDPRRRFLATSSSGPRFGADPADYGKGIHWDVHGPWKAEGNLDEGWTRYWAGDDSLMRSETGSPSASPAHIIRNSAGDLDPMPGTADNPLWRRTSTWWIEWHQFVSEVGREPESLEEYVTWSQERQKKALSIAASACKGRFPRCGGFIVWMGHDCFPCTANTAIIDFEGNPKPAALALKEIWRGGR